MNIQLVRKLIEMGVIRQNTEIEAIYYGVDLAGRPLAKATGTFCIQGVSILKDNSAASFTAVSTVDGSRRIIKDSAVLSVDGMPITRLASIYGVDDQGDAVAQGKRRGRRPRAKIMEEAA